MVLCPFFKFSRPGVGIGPGGLEPDRAEPDFRARAENRRANRARAEGSRAEFWEIFGLSPKLARFLKKN